MSNLSYCRFENTLPDLQDCADALDCEGTAELSESEKLAANALIALCKRIANDYARKDSVAGAGIGIRERGGRMDKHVGAGPAFPIAEREEAMSHKARINAAGQESATDGADTEASVRSRGQSVAGDPAPAAPDALVAEMEHLANIWPGCASALREGAAALRQSGAGRGLPTLMEAEQWLYDLERPLYAYAAQGAGSDPTKKPHWVKMRAALNMLIDALKERTK